MAAPVAGKHLALIGFMGAGKSTLAPLVAARLGRRAIDVDDELGVDIPALFEQGEAAFRAVEEPRTCELLNAREPAVLALGGGAISDGIKHVLRERAFTVLIDVDVDTAWERVRQTDRPLGQDEVAFRRLNDERRARYRELADATATDAEGVVLAAAGIQVGPLDLSVDGPAALISEPTVFGLYADRLPKLGETHLLPTGEAAKDLGEVEKLWRALRLGRDGTIVAFGGGSLTDAAGFVAATYLRGVDWVAVPTTLVGQVDAAIGGKTGIDLPEGKNLVGAFHWPLRTAIDPTLLQTLPAAERLNGMAEVVKTGLLANEPVWELDDVELVRRCAAFKAAVCLRDPHDLGERRQLNLGHTFAHALEAASDYAIPHGRAVALGLRAALRLSGEDTSVVDEVLAPEPVSVDRDRAWQALLRDKKGRLRIVLADGSEAELPEADVRAALDTLIA